jgi:hypothetical protein
MGSSSHRHVAGDAGFGVTVGVVVVADNGTDNESGNNHNDTVD